MPLPARGGGDVERGQGGPGPGADGGGEIGPLLGERILKEIEGVRQSVAALEARLGGDDGGGGGGGGVAGGGRDRFVTSGGRDAFVGSGRSDDIGSSGAAREGAGGAHVDGGGGRGMGVGRGTREASMPASLPRSHSFPSSTFPARLDHIEGISASAQEEWEGDGGARARELYDIERQMETLRARWGEVCRYFEGREYAQGLEGDGSSRELRDIERQMDRLRARREIAAASRHVCMCV